jgi:hypothetical protein
MAFGVIESTSMMPLWRVCFLLSYCFLSVVFFQPLNLPFIVLLSYLQVPFIRFLLEFKGK